MARSNLEFLQISDLNLQGQYGHVNANWQGSEPIPARDPLGRTERAERLPDGQVDRGVSVSYNRGDIVFYNGHLYISNANGNDNIRPGEAYDRDGTLLPTGTMPNTWWTEIGGTSVINGKLDELFLDPTFVSSNLTLVNASTDPTAYADYEDVTGDPVRIDWGAVTSVDSNLVYVMRTVNDSPTSRNAFTYVFRGSDVTTSGNFWNFPHQSYIVATRGSGAINNEQEFLIYSAPATNVLNPIINGLVGANTVQYIADTAAASATTNNVRSFARITPNDNIDLIGSQVVAAINNGQPNAPSPRDSIINSDHVEGAIHRIPSFDGTSGFALYPGLVFSPTVRFVQPAGMLGAGTYLPNHLYVVINTTAPEGSITEITGSGSNAPIPDNIRLATGDMLELTRNGQVVGTAADLSGVNANVQADWTQATTTSDAFILNKPAVADDLNLDGNTLQLREGTTNIDTVDLSSLDNVQSDWTEATTTSDAFILNKPMVADDLNLAGNMLQLREGTTNIDTVDLTTFDNVQANWNEANTSSDSFIQNKPSIGNNLNFTSTDMLEIRDGTTVLNSVDLSRLEDSAQPHTDGSALMINRLRDQLITLTPTDVPNDDPPPNNVVLRFTNAAGPSANTPEGNDAIGNDNMRFASRGLDSEGNQIFVFNTVIPTTTRGLVSTDAIPGNRLVFIPTPPEVRDTFIFEVVTSGPLTETDMTTNRGWVITARRVGGTGLVQLANIDYNVHAGPRQTTPDVIRDTKLLPDDADTGFITHEIQELPTTGTTTNTVGTGNLLIRLTMPRAYRSNTDATRINMDTGNRASNTFTGNGIGEITLPQGETASPLIQPGVIISSAPGGPLATVRTVSGRFITLEEDIVLPRILPGQGTIQVVTLVPAGVANYMVNLNTLENAVPISGDLGSVGTPITNGTAALQVIRNALIGSGRYPGFTFDQPSDDGTTSQLVIHTNAERNDNGTILFAVSNITTEMISSQVGAEGSTVMASALTITPPAPAMAFNFMAASGESVTALLERIATQVDVTVDGWHARREDNSIHFIRDTGDPTTGSWAITINHGSGTLPSDRIAFGTVRVLQTANQRFNGITADFYRTDDGLLALVQDDTPILDNTGHLIEVDDQTAPLADIYTNVNFFSRTNVNRAALYVPDENRLTIGLETRTFGNGELQGGDYIRIGTHRARVNRSGALFNPAGRFDAEVVPDPNFRTYLLSAGATYPNSNVRNYTRAQLVDEGETVVHRFSTRQGTATPIVYNSVTNRIQTANTFIENSRPTSGTIRAGDIWINTALETVVEGVGFGTFVDGNLRRPNGIVLRGLRRYIAANVVDESVIDIFGYIQGASIGANTAPLDLGTYILISAAGRPSTRAFSIGTRYATNAQLADGNAQGVGHPIEDVATIRGLGNLVPVVAERRNPETVAVEALGIGLEDTYNASLYRVSAGSTTQNQPVFHNANQVRVYAKGLHTRNAANTGWVSEVTGYEQLDN